jgi:hypothetical protein
MASIEIGDSQRQYGEGSRAKLDQVRESRRIIALEKLVAISPDSMIIGDPYERPETVKAWIPSTGGSPGSMRRDGYITDGYSHEVLDVTSLSDDCCVSVTEAAEAGENWGEGTVLITNIDWEENRPALVVPRSNASMELVTEALSRHFETAVSLVAQAA